MEENDVQDGGKTPKNFFFRKKRLFIVAVLVFLIGTVTAITALKASENPSFCANCHIIKPYYQSWKDGPLLDAKHGAKNVKCIDCHQKSIPEKMQEGLAYATGKYETPLKERDVSREECLMCHQGDWQKTVEATRFTDANPHDSHLGEIECHLCHKMHRPSEVYCAQCHDFDWYKKLDSSWKQETK